MTITLNTTLPPGYLPDAKDVTNPALLNDPAIQNAVKTTGITVAQYLQLIGLDATDQNLAKMEPEIEKLLPPPNTEGGVDGPGANNLLARLNADTLSVDIYSVMAVFQRCAQQMRSQAREVRSSEMNAQVGSLLNAADEIRKAADERMTAAIVQGAFQIAGGAMTMGMGIAGGIQGAKSIAASKQAATLGSDTAEINEWEMTAEDKKLGLDKLIEEVSGENQTKITDLSVQAKIFENRAQTLNAMAQGAGSLMGGIGATASAPVERAAAEHDAAKARAEADAKVHEQGVQQANDLMQQMLDAIRDVRDKLSAIEQARAQTTSGIARNI